METLSTCFAVALWAGLPIVFMCYLAIVTTYKANEIEAEEEENE